MELATAERAVSVSDPQSLSGLKQRSNDPAVAKAVAGQFGALLMQGMLQSSYGETNPLVGGAAGGNIVSSLFANAVSEAAMSGDKLGLADLLFRSIAAKQHTATGDGPQVQGTAPAPQAQSSTGALPLSPYWHANGGRPLDLNGPQADAPSLTLPRLREREGGADAGVSSAQSRSFAQQLAPLLKEAGRQLGVAPKILLAQAALETGWGRSVAGNNIFGVKAGSSWSGSSTTTMTHEFEEGRMVPREAAFRAYPSVDAAVQDYVALIGGSPRYQSALGAGDDAAAYARGLVAGGYATDNEYAQKLQAVASQPAAVALDLPNGPGPLHLFVTEG